MKEWQSLVQVCKRWQEIIFASPRYLNLFLCLVGDPVAKILDGWPEFPLILSYFVCQDYDNDIHDALAQRDRTRRIELIMRESKADWIEGPMEQQFPHLTHLDLIGDPKYGPNRVPYLYVGGFLGGSAPSLQHLRLDNLNHEGLPSLLMSAPNLVSLQIKNIRPKSYISPEGMVGALAELTKLRNLCIGFSKWFSIRKVRLRQYPHSPSINHAIFPALTKFQFGGDNEYLEDLVALIDAPRLEDLGIEYTKNYAVWIPDFTMKAGNLSQFISRTAIFKHAQFRRVKLTVGERTTCVEFDLPQGECQQACLSLTLVDEDLRELDTAFDVAQVLGQLTIILSDVQHLSIKGMDKGDQIDLLESGDFCIVWFPLLCSFLAVDVLHVPWRLAGSIALMINDPPENMATQVLPALQVLWLDGEDEVREGKLMESIEQFLHFRKQSGHPVVIVNSYDQLIERQSPLVGVR